MQDAVAAGAFASLGGGELLLHLLQQRGLGRRKFSFRQSEIGEPGGVGWRGEFLYGAAAVMKGVWTRATW